MGGECPECNSKDTHYIMMMPVGYFKCFSCNHTWMPGVPEEPLVKLGKDSWVDFPDHKGICQVGYNYDEHVQWFVFAEDKFLLVDWFIQSSPVKGEFGDGYIYKDEYSYVQEVRNLGEIA